MRLVTISRDLTASASPLIALRLNQLCGYAGELGQHGAHGFARFFHQLRHAARQKSGATGRQGRTGQGGISGHGGLVVNGVVGADPLSLGHGVSDGGKVVEVGMVAVRLGDA